jgi:hypothetical protein
LRAGPGIKKASGYLADVQTSDDDKKHAGPEIIENYRDYEPSPEVRKVVEELLETVPEKYLKGLKTIVLCNRAALTRDQRRQKIRGRGRQYRLAEARGAYYQATRSRPASVWLYVDNILKSSSSWEFRVPLVRYFNFSDVLFHEIGHHIHAVHVPVHDGKENVAEDWSRKLTQQFFRRHYWYLVPFRRPLRAMAKVAQRFTMWVAEKRRKKDKQT